MMRSSEQTRRRRSIVNAAAGRTAVVLYACTDDPQPTNILVELRRYADARDWDVVREVTDAVPLATPLNERPEWCAARELILDGRAEGVVAPATHARDDVPHERAELDAWLAGFGAFLAVAPLPSSRMPHPACRAAHFFEADPT